MREIEAIIKNANRNGTRIVMTTPEIGQARRLANEVLFFIRGRLCEYRTAQQFFATPKICRNSIPSTR